ncbi:hypothetical protein [Massilia putida]|uniref:hypothetical protein n=1 Tax=Massilia putida TaxID=1141883 RepID=UPI0012EC4C97|nr:hypothetical protein [Massilia putida]
MKSKIIDKYNLKTPLIGVTGKKHDSAAEAKASFELYKYGFVPYDSMFGQVFFDVEGKPFWARPDFIHLATGVFAEFKTKRTNGKEFKARADKAMQDVEQQIAAGRIKESHRGYKQLEHAWNHSIQKVAAVSNQLPLQTPLVLIYEKALGLNEERRCKKNGVFMLSLQNLSGFAMFLRMASLGLAVGYERHGFRYSAKAN